MWNFLKSFVQVVLMLLGLTGLVDDIVVWQGFVADIVDVYTSVRDYVFSFLPFDVWDWLKDYIIVSIAVTSSIPGVARGVFWGANKDGALHELYFEYAFFIALMLIGWPWIIYIYFFRRTTTPKSGEEVQEFVRNLLWTGVLFLGFLFVASDALTKIFGL